MIDLPTFGGGPTYGLGVYPRHSPQHPPAVYPITPQPNPPPPPWDPRFPTMTSAVYCPPGEPCYQPNPFPYEPQAPRYQQYADPYVLQPHSLLGRQGFTPSSFNPGAGNSHYAAPAVIAELDSNPISETPASPICPAGPLPILTEDMPKTRELCEMFPDLSEEDLQEVLEKHGWKYGSLIRDPVWCQLTR